MFGISHLLLAAVTGGNRRPANGLRWRSVTRQILAHSETLRSLDESELNRLGRELRWKAFSGVSLRKLLTDAYALVREATRRAHGQRHYPVQILGGISLFEGGIAEMQTGEGKTVTAVLPAFLHALTGQGSHVITTNDYLARRDADFAAPILDRLGLSVGCIEGRLQPDERRREYAKDVTYGTAKEMGFDFLRDRLKLKSPVDIDRRPEIFLTERPDNQRPVQRGIHFALVDEADSILVDDARTPLIIANSDANDAPTNALARWCIRTAGLLVQDFDFIYQPQHREAHLTEAGCRKLTGLPKPGLIDSIGMERIYHQMERSLTAIIGFVRDRDYVVAEGKVVIVDESTGRVMQGRKWQNGLHQAIEAKEGLTMTAANQSAARITVQSFFNRYTHLAGLTGTAAEVSRGMKRTYHLRVFAIRTNRPCVRIGHAARVFTTRAAKWNAVADEIGRLTTSKRAILIGTPSVESSELLAAVLRQRRIEHQVLNCRHHEQEAKIVARAGETGCVTIATNMAGRGTDIKIDEEVRRGGGLHVIATEMHSSARIDRQLVGRTARQGDPGSFQFFLSLEDELLRCLKPRRLQKIRRRARSGADGELPRHWVSLFKRTQRYLERLHKKQRRKLLKREEQRNRVYDRMGLDPCLEMTD